MTNREMVKLKKAAVIRPTRIIYGPDLRSYTHHVVRSPDIAHRPVSRPRCPPISARFACRLCCCAMTALTRYRRIIANRSTQSDSEAGRDWSKHRENGQVIRFPGGSFRQGKAIHRSEHAL
jgi:hypothetical protein